MDKLFGKSKPKEEPKPNVNAPTLGETSAKVCDYSFSIKLLKNINLALMSVDGLKRQGNLRKDR